jgi:Uma2 family endonuclease
MEDVHNIPDYLMDTYHMLKCAFPKGVKDNDYIPLLATVHDYMSFRTAADVVSVIAKKDRAVVYNDISGFKIGDPLYPLKQDDLERIREKLIPCGFEEWTQNDRLPSRIVFAEHISYEDYLTGRFGKHTEWIDGKVLQMPDPTLGELRLRWFLRLLFNLYLDYTEGGESLSDPFVMKVGANLPARQPDVFVILPDRLHLFSERGVCDGAANVVVEIVSQGCEDVDVNIKFKEYEQGGVQEYWILDPQRKETLFYVRGEDELFHLKLPVEGVYTSTVLPKLKLKVDILWRTTLPTTTEMLQMIEQMLKES